MSVDSDQMVTGTYSTPEEIRDSSTEIPPPRDGLCDGTDTDHYRVPDAEMISEQPNPTPIKPRSTKYDLRHNPEPNCN